MEGWEGGGVSWLVRVLMSSSSEESIKQQKVERYKYEEQTANCSTGMTYTRPWADDGCHVVVASAFMLLSIMIRMSGEQQTAAAEASAGNWRSTHAIAPTSSQLHLH